MDSDIFFNFIKDSDMKSMKSMINNGYNINTLSKDGKSPIEYSIDLLEFSTNKQANLNIIKFLIESGVTIRENKESIINAIFKYTNGGLYGDHAESIKNIFNLLMEKANTKKITLSTMKGQTKKCDMAYTKRLISIFDFIENNSELSTFNNLVVNYCLL